MYKNFVLHVAIHQHIERPLTTRLRTLLLPGKQKPLFYSLYFVIPVTAANTFPLTPSFKKEKTTLPAPVTQHHISGPNKVIATYKKYTPIKYLYAKLTVKAP